MRDTERLRRRIEEWFTMPIEGHGLWCRYEDAREMLNEVLPLLAAPTLEPERCLTCGSEDEPLYVYGHMSPNPDPCTDPWHSGVRTTNQEDAT